MAKKYDEKKERERVQHYIARKLREGYELLDQTIREKIKDMKGWQLARLKPENLLRKMGFKTSSGETESGLKHARETEKQRRHEGGKKSVETRKKNEAIKRETEEAEKRQQAQKAEAEKAQKESEIPSETADKPKPPIGDRYGFDTLEPPPIEYQENERKPPDDDDNDEDDETTEKKATDESDIERWLDEYDKYGPGYDEYNEPDDSEADINTYVDGHIYDKDGNDIGVYNDDGEWLYDDLYETKTGELIDPDTGEIIVDSEGKIPDLWNTPDEDFGREMQDEETGENHTILEGDILYQNLMDKINQYPGAGSEILKNEIDKLIKKYGYDGLYRALENSPGNYMDLAMNILHYNDVSGSVARLYSMLKSGHGIALGELKALGDSMDSDTDFDTYEE